MDTFSFDDEITFEENVEAFLSVLDEADAEMANILRDNFDKLKPLIEGGSDQRQARTDFNSSIVAALKALDDEQGG